MVENLLKVKISSFEIVLPKYFMNQKDSILWNADIHHKFLEKFPSEGKVRTKKELEKIFERFSCSPDKINKRGFEVPEMSGDIPEEDKIYSAELADGANSHGAHIGKKMKFFVDRSTEVFEDFYSPTAVPPDQLVHVTCTGYVSPSAPQQLVSKNQWEGKTGVTHAYHMGCYASMPAVRIANGMTLAHGYSEDQPYKVDVVHTEMCSLHMNPRSQNPEQIVIQSLFADGHIKYSIDHHKNPNEKHFQIETISEYIIPNSAKYMSWSPTFWGLDMTLSRKVPEAIQSHIKPFVESLLEKSGFSLEEVLKDGIFAVHPGGPKIIDEVQKTLELNDSQVGHSQEVLKNRGNMSSATLPHVWKGILEDPKINNKVVVSLAFGPGLTVFGSVFTMGS